ncbi:DUF2169 family type VI secretion system accessory protein [Sorangium sp. So ce388]|uniref:DUF2169 family type VI secretion system accessory protein n=1 Tax=Sorangium sp. So ce388 TaxID=3133309 RepID=UPI003F5C7224
MWALKNHTAYAADRTWVRDKDGVHHWVVVVKATFDIIESGLRLSDVQQLPFLEPQYTGEPGTSSLRYDADLVQLKSTTDLIVNACAHAPRGKATTSVVVRLQAGSIRKELIVHGPRVFYQGVIDVAISGALPFTHHPITYEWAYGGTGAADSDPRRQRIDLRNPVGKGVAARSADLINQPAYQIEYPGSTPGKTGPAGFGPIASHWSPRRELAGTYDEHWERFRKPLLAADYDERFVLCSPVDQRPPQHLRGGELIELVNMTPEGVLSIQLPKIYLTFSTRFGRRNKEHRSKLACVIIEPEDRRLAMVWQTTLEVGSTNVDYLDETIIREKRYLT